MMTPLPEGFSVRVEESLGEFVVKLDAPDEMDAVAARILSVHLWSAHNECDFKNARAAVERERKRKISRAARR